MKLASIIPVADRFLMVVETMGVVRPEGTAPSRPSQERRTRGELHPSAVGGPSQSTEGAISVFVTKLVTEPTELCFPLVSESGEYARERERL